MATKIILADSLIFKLDASVSNGWVLEAAKIKLSKLCLLISVSKIYRNHIVIINQTDEKPPVRVASRFDSL